MLEIDPFSLSVAKCSLKLRYLVSEHAVLIQVRFTILRTSYPIETLCINKRVLFFSCCCKTLIGVDVVTQNALKRTLN